MSALQQENTANAQLYCYHNRASAPTPSAISSNCILFLRLRYEAISALMVCPKIDRLCGVLRR
jgi:hypothetical protein